MNDFDKFLGLVAKTRRASSEFASAYEAGFDCGKNGASEKNCHFEWFGSREQANEWERGKRAASTVTASQGEK